jgi:hypothetical protein
MAFHLISFVLGFFAAAIVLTVARDISRCGKRDEDEA